MKTQKEVDEIGMPGDMSEEEGRFLKTEGTKCGTKK